MSIIATSRLLLGPFQLASFLRLALTHVRKIEAYHHTMIILVLRVITTERFGKEPYLIIAFFITGLIHITKTKLRVRDYLFYPTQQRSNFYKTSEFLSHHYQRDLTNDKRKTTKIPNKDLLEMITILDKVQLYIHVF